jgi:hypothetical protein
MFADLRAELKAMDKWNRSTALLRTQAEIDAVICRGIRRQEIRTRLLEIAASN